MNLIELLQERARTARWTGIGLLVLGVLALVAPLAAGLSIAIMIGILLIVAGLAQLVLVFASGSWGRALLLLLFGLLSLMVGISMVTQPGAALATLTLLLAAYFIASGVLELIAAVQARPTPGWGWLASSAVVSFLLGVLIWTQLPFSGVWAIGLLVGIRLLMAGLLLVTIASAGAQVVKSAAGEP